MNLGLGYFTKRDFKLYVFHPRRGVSYQNLLVESMLTVCPDHLLPANSFLFSAVGHKTPEICNVFAIRHISIFREYNGYQHQTYKPPCRY